ncbi:pyridoxamine 5'-phosphate oxidase family protein [Candidatus Bipolaricaulota bacterium]|nr:pyridoxamine 5'-phosphate oxidase family protein [Candidatus Bipolaricaulota bacterium]TFH08750.1 MAG: hypothetical protein E4H08_07195 [Candidatus Atribacteria bacterium]
MTVKERILDTLKREEDFLCALATVDAKGCPNVRFTKGVIADDLVILCPTFVSTQKVQDIAARPDISLTCGDTDSRQPGSYFQISGRATISQESLDREAAWTSRLEKWFGGTEDPNYAVVRIVPTRILALPIGGGPAGEIWTSDQ